MADADVTGADLSGVTWSQTTCPDETISDTNGSSPESCCANLQGPCRRRARRNVDAPS